MTLPRPKNTNTTQPTIQRYEDTEVVEDYDPTKASASAKNKNRPYGQPVKNKQIVLTQADLALIEKIRNETGNFSVVFQKTIDGEVWFIKLTRPGSPSGPIEAAIGEVSKFYLDDLSAESAAVYSIKEDGLPEYIGKASKGLPNFKSLLKDPLTDEDLKLPRTQLTTEQLDQLDKDFARKKIKLEELDQSVKIHGQIYPFELIRYRKIKRLASILTFDQFAEEDDGHKNNISIAGDFDHGDKLKSATAKYKEADKLIQKLVEPLDRYYRNPEGRFVVHVYDLDNSPDLKYDKRSVWVNRPGPEYPTIIGKVREILELDTKFYKEGEEINRYKSLKNHKDYVFNRNKMYLRILLTDPKIFAPLLSLQLKKDYAKEVNGKLCYPHRELDELLQTKQSEYRRELRKSKQFKEFLEQHGPYVLKDIEENYEEYNKGLIPLIEACKNDEKPGYKEDLLVSKDQLRTSYINIMLDMHGKVTQDTLLAALKKGNKHVIKVTIEVMLNTNAAISFDNLNKITESNKFNLSQAYLDKIASLTKTNSHANLLNTVGLIRPQTPTSAPCHQNKAERKPGLSL